jgi:phenylacetate-coenzyme A ligase PaaK-like adenylate-forming protein
MDRLRPTVIVGMPGYFYHLLRIAVAAGQDLSYVRAVALGGENAPTGLKRKVVELMAACGAEDVKVASVLGFTEARLCWAECLGARRTGFHTYPDMTLFEIIDPQTGEVLPEGTTGELVYSALDGRGSMVLRYRTGDIVEGGIVSAPCPGCGRTVPRIMSDNIQRVSNVKSLDIGKVKGCLVNLNTLSEVFSGDHEIEEWQVELKKRNDDPYETDEVILYCALRGHEEQESVTRRIQSVILERCELHLNEIRIESLPDMIKRVGMEELTKEVRIVDRRPRVTEAQQKATP